MPTRRHTPDEKPKQKTLTGPGDPPSCHSALKVALFAATTNEVNEKPYETDDQQDEAEQGNQPATNVGGRTNFSNFQRLVVTRRLLPAMQTPNQVLQSHLR